MAKIIINNAIGAVAIGGFGVNPNEVEVDLTNRKKEYTKKVLMNFLRKELLYDIENIAFVLGDSKPEDQQHVRHLVQDIAQKGNIDRVTRIMDVAIAECAEWLYALTKYAVEQTTELDDKLTETAVYKIDMLVPDDFSQTTANLLEKYIHEFIVYRVLYDWLQIADPLSNLYETWLAKAEACKAGIEKLLNRRIGRARKSQTPF